MFESRELREQVNRRLVKGVEGPIRVRCKQFIAKDQHVGVGAKGRMLELFRALADEVTLVASRTAVDILQECFRDVEKEIHVVLSQHHDPLESAKVAIVSSHEQSQRRSDVQRRKRVVEAVEWIIAEAPAAPAALAEAVA